MFNSSIIKLLIGGNYISLKWYVQDFLIRERE